MKFNIYSFWMDPSFYLAAGVFAFSLFLLLFSIRKYLEIKNKSDFEEPADEEGGTQGELPMQEAEVVPPALSAETAAKVSGKVPAPAPAAAAAPRPEPASKAEEFVKGLYQNMASLDARLKNIENVFSKNKVNREFTVTFLEDMISDFDGLDKEKIKVRLEYLVEDLKKG